MFIILFMYKEVNPMKQWLRKLPATGKASGDIRCLFCFASEFFFHFASCLACCEQMKCMCLVHIEKPF